MLLPVRPMILLEIVEPKVTSYCNTVQQNVIDFGVDLKYRWSVVFGYGLEQNMKFPYNLYAIIITNDGIEGRSLHSKLIYRKLIFRDINNRRRFSGRRRIVQIASDRSVLVVNLTLALTFQSTITKALKNLYSFYIYKLDKNLINNSCYGTSFSIPFLLLNSKVILETCKIVYFELYLLYTSPIYKEIYQ